MYTATEYEYDALGNLAETRADADGAAIITRIDYDTMSRKTWIDDPDMGRWEYRYDNSGNLKSQTDAMGREITFDYDGLNRLIRKSFSDGSGDVLYEYDDDVLGGENDVGRLTNISYPAGATRFHYDELGRERQSTKTIDILGYDVTRQYDALNNLTELRYPYGLPVEYTYNDVGQVTRISQGDPGLLYGDVDGSGSITSIDASQATRIVVGLIVPTEAQSKRADVNASGYVSSIDASQIARYAVGILSDFEVYRHIQTFVSDARYNVFGQMTYVALGNGVRTYYRFDPLTQRLQHKKTFSAGIDPQEDGAGWALAGGDLQDLSYTFDAAGNIRSITDSVHTASQAFHL